MSVTSSTNELRNRKGGVPQNSALLGQPTTSAHEDSVDDAGNDTGVQRKDDSPETPSEDDSPRLEKDALDPNTADTDTGNGKGSRNGDGRRSRFGSISQRMRSPLMSSINLEEIRESISKNVEVK